MTHNMKHTAKKNKGPAPYEAEGIRSGFVILFAVVISSIVLAITMGVANIALKEIRFSTSAKDTNEAFFAADTGAECAFFNDKSLATAFPYTGGGTTPIFCGGASVNVIQTGNLPVLYWDFAVPNTGSGSTGCANV